MDKIFRYTVFIPTLLAIFYFGLLASDVYVSESRFIVRQANPQPVSLGLGSLMADKALGLAGGKAQDADYSIHDYILSRDALSKLDSQFHFKTLFNNWHIDFLHRFGLLGWDTSFEALYKYYKNRVNLDLDPSSISILQVRAFSAKDAHDINQKLIYYADEFINKLNMRTRKDMVEFAKEQVDLAKENATQASLALSNYRKEEGLFDPNRESALHLQQVLKAEMELKAVSNYLAELEDLTPRNPQISALRKKRDILEASVNSEKMKVSGNNDSLTIKNSQYERLVLNTKFAYKQLVVALSSLKQAQMEAQRKQLYLQLIAKPNQPDVAIEPYRLRNIVTVFILGLIFWGIFTLLVANIKEHLA